MGCDVDVDTCSDVAAKILLLWWLLLLLWQVQTLMLTTELMMLEWMKWMDVVVEMIYSGQTKERKWNQK